MNEELDDIILSELNDDELVQQMFDDLYDGLREEIEEAVNILLERKWQPYDVLTKALVSGMTRRGMELVTTSKQLILKEKTQQYFTWQFL